MLCFGKEDLSEVGKQYLAGLLAHARGACAFATPTINGYKRYRPYSLAPDRDLGQGEPRRHAPWRARRATPTLASKPIGEPAANPYLYFTADLLRRHRAPLAAAALGRHALRGEGRHAAAHAGGSAAPARGQVLRHGFGAGFIDYYCRVKEAEIARFNLEVSDWEHANTSTSFENRGQSPISGM